MPWAKKYNFQYISAVKKTVLSEQTNLCNYLEEEKELVNVNI